MNIKNYNMFNKIQNIYCWNANSISNKFEEIIVALNQNEIDIIAIDETKIDENDEYLYTSTGNIYFLFFCRVT
jgi:exonuclease III